jgi:restriction endonuclease S subunit
MEYAYQKEVINANSFENKRIQERWFPKLRDASEKERNNWRLIGGGIGIHWEDIDEDLSIVGLL